MQFLSQVLKPLKEYQTISAAVMRGRLPVAAAGLSHVQKAHLILSLCQETKKSALVIASDEAEARRLVDDLTAMMGDGIYYYPQRDFTFRPVESISREFEHERLKILGLMKASSTKAVITCADAAMQYTIPPQEYSHHSLLIKRGQTISQKDIISALVNAGYVRCAQVEGIGQFSLRGGILDFFPAYLQSPVRMEFWGDEIDTIAYFDAETQRRTEDLEQVEITPACEVIFTSELSGKLENLIDSLHNKSYNTAKQHIKADLIRLQDSGRLPANDKYLPLIYKPATIFDYSNGLIFICEPAKVKERARAFEWQMNEDIKLLLEDGILAKGLTEFAFSYDEFTNIYQQSIFLDTFARSSLDLSLKEFVTFNTRQLSVWGGDISLLEEDLSDFSHQNITCVILAGTLRAAEALAYDLRGRGFSAIAKNEIKTLKAGQIVVLPGRLSAGMEYFGAGFALITHGRPTEKLTSKVNKRYKSGDAIRNLTELKIGDYVVHSGHGIGIFEGISKLDVQGIIKDYIKIRYAGSDILYVPVTQLDLVSKYIGGEESGIKINKMGGEQWQKIKARVHKAVKDIAKELTILYAERLEVKGHDFSTDNEWQRDFEERFEYTETDDQLRSIEEIKRDMERPVPMDRLLCGDVGFGKTEVALRGAFKCALDGKQCAILVPTTILAMQHYQTVTRRMEGFPIRVELLSRYRSPKQQEDILKRLKHGEIDIIIGTHRLVQKDIAFRDLGLVIIDEEQRFGVAQKEHLKERFKNVDVLTLSATPIPRTLNMALSGIRDMSAIEEAPQDRHPVQTYVLEHDFNVLADALRRELRRGGQSFYLHNRIESIDSTAAKLSQLIPEARIAVTHGRMDENQMSAVWEKLVAGDIDILVCTTIIETGIDVANANTLIIEDADKMGLAQLHQIRGRVGRSSRRAYAYFTFKKGKIISEVATKRLAAIREFTEFGSGFRIALRDLEIRGAGNILGGEQHGHMEAVGYDMYLRLLNDAISLEKGEMKPTRTTECTVDLQITAHIPEKYIENNQQRLDIYRRIADIHSNEDAIDVVDELIDRFGEPPKAVKSLVDVALLRNKAASLGIREIAQNATSLLVYPEVLDPMMVAHLVGKLKGRVLVNAGVRPYLQVKFTGDAIDAITDVVNALE